MQIRNMKLTLASFLLTTPVLGDVLYDVPLIRDLNLMHRTTGMGAHCVRNFRRHLRLY